MITLNRHTNFHHFTGSVPYTKFIKNFVNAVKERIAVSALSNHKDIINKVITEELGDSKNGE